MTLKKITTAVMMAVTATNVSAAELILTLEEGAESVGKQVDYADFESRSGNTEVVSVGDDEVEASISLLNQRSDVQAVDRNVIMKAPKPQATPIVQATGIYDDEGDDTTFNDPLFPQQYAWRQYSDSQPGGSTVTRAVTQAQVYDPVSVVVIDGGFASSDTFQWSGGYNFIDDSDQTGGLNIGSEFRTSPSECSPHGQWVASVMGGVPNDGVGNTGVLENANFYGARVLDCGGAGPLSKSAKAIRWAIGESVTDADGNPVPTIAEPADVINLSLSALTGNDGCSTALQDAIDAANAAGAVITVASGNQDNGSPGTNDEADLRSPANCTGVVTVSGTEPNGEPGPFSTGSVVDISAGGVEVPAYAGNTAQLVTGTSFSAPMVGAIVGNLLQDVPALDSSVIRTTVMPNAANAINNPNNLSLKMGDGLIDANKLQQAAVDIIDPPDFELRHPAGGACGGTKMLDALAQAQGNGVCDLREVRVNTDLAANGKYAVIYEVPDGAEMTVGNGSVFQASQAQRFMLNSWDGAKQYGIQKCDGADGTGCSSGDALIPLDMDGIRTQCSS